MAESVRSAVQRQLDQLASGIEVLATMIIRRSIIDAHDRELWAGANPLRGAVVQFTVRVHPAVSLGLPRWAGNLLYACGAPGHVGVAPAGREVEGVSR